MRLVFNFLILDYSASRVKWGDLKCGWLSISAKEEFATPDGKILCSDVEEEASESQSDHEQTPEASHRTHSQRNSALENDETDDLSDSSLAKSRDNASQVHNNQSAKGSKAGDEIEEDLSKMISELDFCKPHEDRVGHSRCSSKKES